jgi:hypothetical protein
MQRSILDFKIETTILSFPQGEEKTVFPLGGNGKGGIWFENE